jgi:hypothetical protein
MRTSPLLLTLVPLVLAGGALAADPPLVSVAVSTKKARVAVQRVRVGIAEVRVRIAHDHGEGSGKGKGSDKPDKTKPDKPDKPGKPDDPGSAGGSGPADAPTSTDPLDPDDPGADSSSGGSLPADPTAPFTGPPPTLGTSVAAEAVTGSVLVQVPGAKGFAVLDPSELLPVGATVDATRGRITLRAAVGTDGTSQTGTFWGGVFTVQQSARERGMTELSLASPPTCDRMRPRPGVAQAKERPPSRSVRLWGSDSHGRFRTRGLNSVATVRGTRWLTQETCAGTLTRVAAGAVAVRDLRAGRTVVVRAGHQYLARAHR